MVMAGQQSECKYAKETVHLKMFKMVNFVLWILYHNKKFATTKSKSKIDIFYVHKEFMNLHPMGLR